jgi:hypothetical protein
MTFVRQHIPAGTDLDDQDPGVRGRSRPTATPRQVAGSTSPKAGDPAQNLVERFVNDVVRKYLIDLRGRRVPFKSRCVIWIGKKTGLQPVEPYTCMHYYLPRTGLQGAIVVSAEEYESAITYKSAMKELQGRAFVVPAFPGRQIRFLRWGDVLDVVDTVPFTRMSRPMEDDIVCVIDRCGQTNK